MVITFLPLLLNWWVFLSTDAKIAVHKIRNGMLITTWFGFSPCLNFAAFHSWHYVPEVPSSVTWLQPHSPNTACSFSGSSVSHMSGFDWFCFGLCFLFDTFPMSNCIMFLCLQLPLTNLQFPNYASSKLYLPLDITTWSASTKQNMGPSLGFLLDFPPVSPIANLLVAKFVACGSFLFLWTIARTYLKGISTSNLSVQCFFSLLQSQIWPWHSHLVGPTFYRMESQWFYMALGRLMVCL